MFVSINPIVKFLGSLFFFSDGATASGVYVALSFLIEQMKLEHECDVCLAVRTIRHNRKQFVTDEVRIYSVSDRKRHIIYIYIAGFVQNSRGR